MDEHEPHIWLTRREDSGVWVIRFEDPETGRIRQKSTRTENKREAERRLGQLRADLLNHRVQRAVRGNIAWDDFRRRYEDEVLAAAAPKTREKVDTVFNAMERLLKPGRLRDLTSERLSHFQAKLREEKTRTKKARAETTIAGYLAHLKAALRWAVDIQLLPAAPRIVKPRRVKTSKLMKGRPITDEEFERMKVEVGKVVGEHLAASWRHYLDGLWWSGLRLTESLKLAWDETSEMRVVNVESELMLQIPADVEKGNKDRLLPIAPEFVEFLRKTPKDQQRGYVFTPLARSVRGERLTADRVSRIVGRVGKSAGVVVDSAKRKFASAHDLRRSFGERWAARIMPQELMELMRHESIETTLKYYVGRNAMRTSKRVREAYEQAQASHRQLPERGEDGLGAL